MRGPQQGDAYRVEYQAQIIQAPLGPLVDNPETPQAFAQRMVRESVKSWVKTFESQQAAESARAAANTAADQIGIS